MDQFPNRDKEKPLSERDSHGVETDSELDQMDVDGVQPGTSGAQYNPIRSQESGDNASKNTKEFQRFKMSMEPLKPMERRMAQAFLDRKIPNDFKWQIEGETKDEAAIRKQFNSRTLKRPKERKSSSCTDS